jgi:1,2-diacylglycerol 3-beta-galactosyltransferase
MEKKRILILTADAGFGHRSAANAVAAALQERYGEECEIEIANPLEDPRCPFFLRDSQADYDKIVQQVPELYRFGYTASDAAVPAAVIESALTVLLFEVMYDILKKQRPDVILTTYPLYQDPLVSIFSVTRRYVPLYTVITDLAYVHRIWYHRKVTSLLAPTDTVRDAAISHKIPDEKVHVTGIPVNPAFANENRKKGEIRRALGWAPNLPTLLFVGSKRVERLAEMVNLANHFGMRIQLAVVAGKDTDLFQKLQAMEWHQLVHLYEYASNMPELMHAADGVICKAGGLVVTEALACGKPLLLISAIPGQEIGNATFVVSRGAATLAQTPTDFLEALWHWMADGRQLLREQAHSARLLGKPNAAYQVAELLWKAAQSGAVDKKRIAGRARLLDLLRQNKVPWQDQRLPWQDQHLPWQESPTRKFRIL